MVDRRNLIFSVLRRSGSFCLPTFAYHFQLARTRADLLAKVRADILNWPVEWICCTPGQLNISTCFINRKYLRLSLMSPLSLPLSFSVSSLRYSTHAIYREIYVHIIVQPGSHLNKFILFINVFRLNWVTLNRKRFLKFRKYHLGEMSGACGNALGHQKLWNTSKFYKWS